MVRLLRRFLPMVVAVAALAAGFKCARAADDLLVPQMIQQYLDGDWDTLEKNITQHAKEIAALPKESAADVAYIKQALLECYPAWWGQTKLGNNVVIRPNIWGRSFVATYDPTLQSSLQMNSVNNQMTLRVNWAAGDMESPARAEHGFTKGDLANLGIWGTLGEAEIWVQVTPTKLTGLSGPEKVQFQRFQDFRGILTSIYYGTPRGREWGCFLSLDAFGDRYTTAPAFIPRKPVGAMLLAEIAKDPGKYPSLRMPARIPEENTESRLAAGIMNQLQRPLTFAEDKALREAAKALAGPNGTAVYNTGKVSLANKLQMTLDPTLDGDLAQQRSGWLYEKLTNQHPATGPATQAGRP